MTDRSSLAGLAGYLTEEVAIALLNWCDQTGRGIHIPADRWSASGYTGAVLAPLFITTPGGGSQLVVVKVLPHGQHVEPEAHDHALSGTGEAFRRHLVRQPFPPLRLPGGGALMFQELAGGSRDWRPLADLPPDRRAEACRAVATSLIADWNADFAVRPMGAVEYLRREIALSGTVGRPVTGGGLPAHVPWFRTAEDPPVPNPLHLLTSASGLGGLAADLAVGRTHGDLHDQNVLMEQGRFRSALDTFVLVDLSTYAAEAPLSRDLVTLLLSVTAELLTRASGHQQRALLRVFVQPEAQRPMGEIPAVLTDVLRAVYDTAATLLSRGGRETWRRQYLLSLIAHGLIFTTFVNLGPTGRWWFFRLAGYAAAELWGNDPRPASVPTIGNPFAADPRPAPEPPTDPVARPRGQYSGAVKVEFCQRLGDSWRDLADRLEIPPYERLRFPKGYEAQALWEYLEIRGRVDDLVPALRGLNRLDLVALLDSRPRPGT